MVKLNIIAPGASALPSHLGGHENETHLDEGALDYIIEKFGVKSMIDVGRGPAGMVELARSKGLEVLGVDGDFIVDRTVDDIVIHDYQKAPYHLSNMTWHGQSNSWSILKPDISRIL